MRANIPREIYGDAWTWWDKAAGKFPREAAPESGAVLVLTGLCRTRARPCRGGARACVQSREIRVDHANWLGDGAIYLDDPVADVSENNDWSQVRVWNIRTGGWGIKIYPVQGFIGPGGSGANRAGTKPSPVQTPHQIARA